MPASPSTATATVYTAANLAEVLGFSAQAVYSAVERLGLEPVSKTPSGIKLYDDGALRALREQMDPQCRDRQRTGAEKSDAAGTEA